MRLEDLCKDALLIFIESGTFDISEKKILKAYWKNKERKTRTALKTYETKDELGIDYPVFEKVYLIAVREEALKNLAVLNREVGSEVQNV